MIRSLRSLLPVAALLSACACMPQPGHQVYGPREEGLTLAYEDPSLPQPQQSQERLQVRVAKASFPSAGTGTVLLDYTSLRGSLTLALRHQAGGIALLGPDGKDLAQLLPEGFPRVASWQARGTSFQVIGRGAWDGAAMLPSTSPSVGVWVEARPASGVTRRTLYLPDLGEVESLELRQGVWIPVNRLVARGFTDLPAAKPSSPEPTHG